MFESFVKILDSAYKNSVHKKIIIKTDFGYELFSEYYITKQENGYKIFKAGTDVEHTFSFLKNAVIWASFYKTDKILDADRVLLLDQLLNGINFSIELNVSLSKKTKDLEKYSIYVTKIVEDKTRRDQIKKELNSYEQMVKKWQYSQFNAITS